MGTNLAIDCDPTKFPQKGHGGTLANDPIDDIKVNAKYEVVMKPQFSSNAISIYEDFVHLYITESCWESIENGDEIYISYGRQYWLYAPFLTGIEVVCNRSRIRFNQWLRKLSLLLLASLAMITSSRCLYS